MLTASDKKRLIDLKTKIDTLLPREKLTLHGLCDEGLSNKQLAYRLGVSSRTIEATRANLYKTMDVATAAQLGRVYGEWKTLERLARQHERGA
jgi:FixJ family two-component response regulator